MNSRSLYVLMPFALAAGWSLAVWGCSANARNNTFESETSTSSDNGSSGGGGKSGTSSGEGGLGFSLDGGSEASLEDAACAATSSEATPVPLDIVMVLDRSGSMDLSGKWQAVVSSLKQYVNSADAIGVHVGLEYFPVEGVFEECDYTLYDDLVVPIAELPGNALALSQSMDSTYPGGGTPMYGALKGAYYVATQYQDANPTHKVIVVFASDGDPSGCSGSPNVPPAADDIPVIASLSESALNYNGVRTYVIAIPGATVSNLNQIAAKGGTMQALDVTQNINLFLDKMKEIQASALPCDFPIPDPPMGQSFDKDLVQVVYDPSDPLAMDIQIPHSDNLQDCGQAPGWYYDNNLKPTKIVLCPKSCQTLKADYKAKVNVLFGCKPDLN